MKKFEKLIALVLVLVLVLSLAACKKAEEKSTEAPASGAPAPEHEADASESDSKTDASKDPAPSVDPVPATSDGVVGKWASEVSIQDLMAANADSASQEELELVNSLFGDGSIIVNLELTADGKIVYGIDEDSMEAMVKAMTENVDKLIPMIAEANGMTAEEFTAAMEEQGMTMDQFKASVAEQIQQQDLIGQMGNATVTGIYRQDGDKVYVGEAGKELSESQYIVVDVTASTLTIKEAVGLDKLSSEEADFDGIEKMLPWTFNKVG